MFVQQFFVKGIAHSSYLLGGNKNCAIVDPRRDIQIYLDAAKEMGMQITHILETHLHADFISGHLDLAKATGAKIYAPGQCDFEYVEMTEGEAFSIDDLEIKVIETPGHTPEHITYIVTDRARGAEPACIFCGDTLFVGDVGRPDLFPGIAEELAEKLYHSLHEKLLKLPNFCEVYPAHGAGSLCGRAMGAKRSSTIGYEKLYNPALQIKNVKEFIASLTTDMPPAPDHFSRCSAINAKGPSLLEDLPVLTPLTPAEFNALSEQEHVIVLDTRDFASFGGLHVPGSYHVDFGGNFATFAAWVLPSRTDLLLVSENPQQAHDAVTWLRRVGLDRVIGYLEGGIFEWGKHGLETDHVHQLSTFALHEKISNGEQLTLVDARSPKEFEALHIEGAINIPSPDLRTRYKELPPNLPIVLICGTGHRSSLGCSILKQRGFKDVYNAAGGMTAYNASGFSPECPMCVGPHGPAFLG